ncbi:mechanosensitive ion channel family protein [Lacticigenium naphthae]|uniref:mechanosensitive ion channel family protein n=1 Tax=Lacticigenium naphthae TaxID=515351 RepID=UPI00041B0008|nr:mechanosensitive ion channel domain-containing protein [Lacticigenium naphthae]
MEGIRTFIDSYPTMIYIISFIILAIILYIIRQFLLNRLYPRLKESEHWYLTRKISRWLNGFVLFLLFLALFGNRLSGFSTAIGLAGAGITYALREVIVSFAGWFAILFGDFFSTGDRVLLGGIKGDVIDIGVLRTTLMEMGEWVEGDQYTGRIVRVANSYIFTSPVYNYTANFEFLWDEIHIPIRFSSDVILSRAILLQVADDVLGKNHPKTEAAWANMRRKYRVEETSLKPSVFISFDDNWIELSLRYVVDFRERRIVRDLLFTEILKRFKDEGKKIELASETVEIIHEIPPINQEK